MYVRFMTSHPVNPAVVDRLTNHSNARLEPLDTLMNENNENAACIYNISIINPQKNLSRQTTDAKQDRNQGQSTLRTFHKDLGCLSSQSQTIQYTRSTEQETIARGERACENACVDYVREAANTGTSNSDDEGGLSSCAGSSQKVWVVVGHKHADD